jgi:hypothetical protein
LVDPTGLFAQTLPWVEPVIAYCWVNPLICAAVVGTGVIVGEIGDVISDAICKNADDGCKPCKTISGRIVAKGTVAYRPLDVIPDDEKQHGIYGSHHNIFIAKQNPNNCQCFW